VRSSGARQRAPSRRARVASRRVELSTGALSPPSSSLFRRRALSSFLLLSLFLLSLRVALVCFLGSEAGWEARGQGSSLRRNAEVWKFFGSCAIQVLKARKLEGDEGSAKKTEAAEFARDGLLRLGPTFVKLGQVGPEAY
jgi:hypothetical protein